MCDAKVGKWNLVEKLGEGGYAKVFLGEHQKTKEKAAVKILYPKKNSKNSTEVKQVATEIKLMQKINHPNVLRLKDSDMQATLEYRSRKGVDVKQDVLMCVLELAGGGELFEFLSFTGCFSEKIAKTYFHQLVMGLKACHDSGFAHRDLKPENLLLDDNFVLKIADFGFAKSFEGDKKMQTECGTHGYMAPEMFRQGMGYDAKKTDVWACGVVLFIMLAGFPPYQKPNRNDWWWNKLYQKRQKKFWQAHCRTGKFSENAKDLINSIFTFDYTKRADLDYILKHPFMKEEPHPYSQKDLVKAMEPRKVSLDRQNGSVNKGNLQRDIEMTGNNVVRGDPASNGGSEDSLPSIDCLITWNRAPEQKKDGKSEEKKQEKEEEEDGEDDGDEDEDEDSDKEDWGGGGGDIGDGDEDEKDEFVAPVYVEHQKCYTKFKLEGVRPAQALAALKKQMEKHKINWSECIACDGSGCEDCTDGTVELTDENYDLEVAYQNASTAEVVKFRAAVYATEKDNTEDAIVVCKRLSGGSHLFRFIYGKLREGMI